MARISQVATCLRNWPEPRNRIRFCANARHPHPSLSPRERVLLLATSATARAVPAESLHSELLDFPLVWFASAQAVTYVFAASVPAHSSGKSFAAPTCSRRI
jgi:hypothetical protein